MAHLCRGGKPGYPGGLTPPWGSRGRGPSEPSTPCSPALRALRPSPARGASPWRSDRSSRSTTRARPVEAPRRFGERLGGVRRASSRTARKHAYAVAFAGGSRRI
eukprot:7499416-Lingulodinium_polyedra.AAC.1